MSIARALVVACSFGFALPSQGRPAKRIAQGSPLSSPDEYDTYHFIQLRKSWGCISNQALHELGGCEEWPYCAGTLFHPEFVITAAHCVATHEFHLKKIADVYDVLHLFGPDGWLNEDERRIYGRWDDDAEITFEEPNFNHAFYSNIALLGGSVDYFGMTQIRHAIKKFPHPNYVDGTDSVLNHDIAILQVCQPFDLTETLKIAPMVALNELKEQWDSIITRSVACLYAGFGATEDPSMAYTRGRLNLKTRYMRYTWRYVGCSSFCQPSRPWDIPKNPCTMCSHHIPPKIGSPYFGDSGSPIVCDGHFVALHSSGFFKPELNKSSSIGYPIHCIRDAITPERLESYREVTPGKGFHPLGPVLR